jgi:hypothetical protein
MSALGIDAVAPHDPKIVGNLMYVSWFQAGTLIFDITDPTKPVLVGSYDTYPASPAPGQLEGNWGVYPFLGQDRVLMSDRETGLYIVDAMGVSSQPALYNLHITPETVLAGSSAVGAVYLVGLGGTGGTVITTWSDNSAAVPPPHVTVPANATTAAFTIPTTAVNSTTIANITTSLNGASNSAAVTITSVPDYSITMGPSTLTIFPNQNGAFSGVAKSFGGYSHSVALTCTAPAPPTCAFSPASVTPTTSGTPFSLTVASLSTTTYAFNVQGTGSDSLKRLTPITVNVSDFMLGSPTPSALNLTPGSSSQFSVQVGAAGTFAALVDLSCNAPASGIACSFSPSGTVMPTAATPITVTVSVSVPATVGPGLYGLTISGTSLGVPSPKVQTIPLAVVDFAVSTSTPSQTVHAGQTATYALNVLPVSGAFNTAIALSCSGAPALSSCSVVPASVTPGSSTTSVNVTVSTTSPTSARSNLNAFLVAVFLPLGAVFFGRQKRIVKSATVFFALTTLIACGGGSSASSPAPTPSPKPGTPSGTYTLTITADADMLHHPTTLTLIVK